MADLTHEQIDEWDRWFREIRDKEEYFDRPAGCYALTDMARKYLKLSQSICEPQNETGK